MPTIVLLCIIHVSRPQLLLCHVCHCYVQPTKYLQIREKITQNNLLGCQYQTIFPILVV